jgi:putative radical SAM enzyme (TIGR03279 family)
LKGRKYLKTKKDQGHLIKKVYADSIAEEMGIEAGDYLLAINDEEIEDVFDYRYLIKDEYIEVLIRKQDGEEWLLEIEKDYEDDLGIEFDNSLMSNYRSCCNKCIFCFVDQMPPGMRETLYFKDDDSRLSFLQGNYITLTNMKQKDVDRIIRMHLAPINISIQTTNPELRSEMLHNRFAGEKLKFLDTLYEGRIEMNGQIVLCKNVNDGSELERSIDDLSKYLPFMRSVSAVPAGITKYRKGLYLLELFNKQEAGAVIDMIESRQNEFYDKYGLHFIHASDEWYITAERDFPEEERYDGYIQLENGVGMMRLLINEFNEALSLVKKDLGYKDLRDDLSRTITIATGKLTYPTLKIFASQIMELFPKIHINVACIRNDFFGETITVSGLITGQDLIKQLSERKNVGGSLGDVLYIPSNMLRMGEQVFLDDVSVSQVEKALEIHVVAIDSGGKEFINAILSKEYRMDRNNENFVYIQAYQKKGNDKNAIIATEIDNYSGNEGN